MASRIYEHDKQQGLVQAWHGNTEVVSTITLEDNWLRKWDLVPVQMEKRGKPTKWTILECTDLGEQLEIGQPYNPQTFQPVNNADFLDMVKQCLAGTDHKIATVGSIRNRGRVFLSVELMGMEKFKAAGRDFGAYLNFGNGHDKSSVLWVNTSNICTVCDNTFTFNLVSVENKAKNNTTDDNLSVRQRHTKNVKLRLPELAKLVDKAVGVHAQFQLELDKLNEVEIPHAYANNLFAGFVGRNISQADRRHGLSTRAFNTVSRLGELFLSGKGNSGETLADAFSAVTDYYSHESSGGNNVMRQVMSSEYGAGNQSKQDFWRIVRDTSICAQTVEVGEELLTNTAD